MRKRWLIHGIVACAAIIGSGRSVHAQATTSTSGVGTTGGLTTSSSLGTTTTSGQSGGIATLGTATGKTGANSGTTSPAPSDPFGPTYANLLTIQNSGVNTSFSYNSTTGQVSQIGTQTGFGQPTWAATTVNTQTTAVKNTTGTNNQGFNTLTITRTPPYMTVLSESMPVYVTNPTKLQETLVSKLANVPMLQGNKDVFVAVNGSTVYIKGQVKNNDERRVLEGVVRVTPGVRNVVNELVALKQ